MDGVLRRARAFRSVQAQRGFCFERALLDHLEDFAALYQPMVPDLADSLDLYRVICRRLLDG
jgi:hypothetical protein